MTDYFVFDYKEAQKHLTDYETRGACMTARDVFNARFALGDAKGRLHCYGVIKLRALCKHKKVPRYGQLNKQQMIDILSEIVQDSDFPIKM